MEKKKNKFKNLFTRLGIILGGVILGFSFAFGLEILSNKSNFCLISNIENSDGIRLKQNKVAVDTSSLCVSAEITPANARDKTVSWSVAWSSSDCPYNISDFISLDYSDDSLNCWVNVLKPFEWQAILTCKSNMVPSVKATCSIDYIKRTAPSGVTETNKIFGGDPTNYTVDMFMTQLISSAKTCISNNLSGGTITPTVSATKYSITNFTLCGKQTANVFTQSYCQDYDFCDILQQVDDLHEEDLISQMGSSVSIITFNYDLVYDDVVVKSGTAQYYFTIGFDISSFSVTSVTLDDSSLFF